MDGYERAKELLDRLEESKLYYEVIGALLCIIENEGYMTEKQIDESIVYALREWDVGH